MINTGTHIRCNVKNITLSVDENVLKAVRRYAAERDSSVNKFVREFLAGVSEREDRARNARLRIQELSRHSTARVDSFGDRLLNLEIGLRFSKAWQQAARRERASRWMLSRFSQEF